LILETDDLRNYEATKQGLSFCIEEGAVFAHGNMDVIIELVSQMVGA
jgi:hypothetical protein